MSEADSIAWNAHVHDVSPARLSERAKLHDYNTLVVFYAHWCGHCQALHDPLNELAKSGMNVVVVDTSKHRMSLKAPFIEGVGIPQIFSPGSGAWVQYKGVRTVPELKAFVTSQGGRALTGGGAGKKSAGKKGKRSPVRGGAACFVEFEGGGGGGGGEAEPVVTLWNDGDGDVDGDDGGFESGSTGTGAGAGAGAGLGGGAVSGSGSGSGSGSRKGKCTCKCTCGNGKGGKPKSPRKQSTYALALSLAYEDLQRTPEYAARPQQSGLVLRGQGPLGELLTVLVEQWRAKLARWDENKLARAFAEQKSRREMKKSPTRS
jgi:thiol-disulfide isomerase/thioredoxin